MLESCVVSAKTHWKPTLSIDIKFYIKQYVNMDKMSFIWPYGRCLQYKDVGRQNGIFHHRSTSLTLNILKESIQEHKSFHFLIFILRMRIFFILLQEISGEIAKILQWKSLARKYTQFLENAIRKREVH